MTRNEYEKCPRRCKACGKNIPWPKRRNKFCDHSCSASFNNEGVRRHGNPPPACEECGKKTRDSQKKYCSLRCQKVHEYKRRMEAFLAGTLKASVRTFKKLLIEARGAQCSICHRTKWMSKDIPLVMDHIDGNSDNDAPLNLRLVCGNCDMQLPTYKNKNKGNGRHSRRERYKEGKSY